MYLYFVFCVMSHSKHTLVDWQAEQVWSFYSTVTPVELTPQCQQTHTHTRGHITHTHLVTLTSTPHCPLMIDPWLYSHGHIYRASPVALDNCDPDSEHTCSTLAHHCYLWPLCPLWTLTSASTWPLLDINPTLLMSTVLLLCHSHTVTAIYVFQLNYWDIICYSLQGLHRNPDPDRQTTNTHYALLLLQSNPNWTAEVHVNVLVWLTFVQSIHD